MRRNSNSDTSTSSPLLNDYKRNFVLKRLLQTILGGPIFKFSSSIKSPAYIYILQIILYMLPFVFGGISILIHDLVNTKQWNLYISIIAGSLYFLLILSLKISLLIIVNKSYQTKQSENAEKANRLSDEQNFEFTKFFSKSTIEFLIPTSSELFNESNPARKTAKIVKSILQNLFDSCLVGLIMFSSVYFESIIYLQNFYSLAASIILFILHWIVLVMSCYSLCFRNPPELAIYQPYDNLNINRYYRVFYVFCFQLIELIFNFSVNNANIPTTVIFYLKIFFTCLPLGWYLGILPPIDALILWFSEQCYMYLYGGTATASNLRLLFQFTLAILVSMAHFIPSDIAIVIIFTLFGYILSSIDLMFIFEWILVKVQSKNSKVAPSDHVKEQKKSLSKKFPPNWKDWLYHVLILLITITVSVVIFSVFDASFSSNDTPFLIETILLYISIGVFIIGKILGDFQSVFIFFGLVRNPFYPTYALSQSLPKLNSPAKSINAGKKIFQILKYTRLVLIKIFAPLILTAVISIDCSMNKIYGDSTLSYWRTLTVWRAYRWVWQSSYDCLFEMGLTHVVLFSITYNSISDTATKTDLIKYFLTGCLCASFIIDRLSQLFNKLYAFLLITITAWTIKKQRRRLALAFLIINIILIIPFLVFIALPSCVISAPLLPLFTFPIFLFAFPRPLKFWPQKQNFFSRSINLYDENFQTKKINSPESFFYSQLVPDLVKSFKEHIRSGSIGQSIKADTFFLSRFQDRIIWIQVLESSNSYYIINIKGLELQETSCHTREAQYIDDLFELNFENPTGADSNSQSKSKFLVFNKKPFNCMNSKDVLVLNAYSDARNSLVGILDYPDNLAFLSQIYPKVLHYFIILYLVERKQNLCSQENFEISPDSAKEERKSIQQNEEYIQMSPLDHFVTEKTELTIGSTISKKNIVLTHETTDSFDDWSDDDSNFEKKIQPKKNSLKNSNLSSSSAKYKNQEIESFDFDLNEILGTQINENSKSEAQKNQNQNPASKKTPEKSSTKNKNVFNIIPSPRIKSPVGKSDSNLALPVEWLSFIKENLSSNSALISESLKNAIMTKNWIRKILSNRLADKLDDQDVNKYEMDLWTSHYKFLLKCVQTLGLDEKVVSTNLNSDSINNFYLGNLPWSPTNEKITQIIPDLHNLLVKAFRYAIKMTIDHATICPITDDDEFFETIESFENEWYIGCENDDEFAQNIHDQKPFIFTLHRDSSTKTLNSRTLSIQQIKSPLARLNSEIVKSIWSSTNLELLYMTNDDEERYSIQAHDFILRNLTIQSSDPPLGYAVYNSENVFISMANPFFE